MGWRRWLLTPQQPKPPTVVRNGAFDPIRHNKSSVDRPKRWKRYLHGTLRNQTRNTILDWISRKDGQAWTREGFSRPESTITKHNGIEKNARKQRFPRGTSQGYIARRAIFYFLFLVKELRGRRGRALEKFSPSPARKLIKTNWKKRKRDENEKNIGLKTMKYDEKRKPLRTTHG